MNWHTQRLREELHKEIGLIIAGEMRDPRIPDVVTITDVRLAPDCRNATVFVSVMGDPAVKKDAVAALNHAVPARIVMKFVPKLYFKLDKSMEESEHINELLKEIKDDLV